MSLQIPPPTLQSWRPSISPSKCGPHHFFLVSSPYHGLHHPAAASSSTATSPASRPRDLPPSPPSSPPSLPLRPPSPSCRCNIHGCIAMDLQHPFVVGAGALPQRAAELVDESLVGAAEVRVRGGAGPPRRLPVQQHLPAPTFLISHDCSSVPRGISGIVRPPRPTLPARKPRPAASSHPWPTGPPPASLPRSTVPPPDDGLHHGQEESSRLPNDTFFPCGTASSFTEPLYMSHHEASPLPGTPAALHHLQNLATTTVSSPHRCRHSTGPKLM
jgi:hypothetical protein